MVGSPRNTPALLFVVAALFVIVLSGNVLARRVPITVFRPDESGWISAGYHYAGLLLRGDFTWEQWECQPCGGWGALNMQLGKLLVGLPITLLSTRDLDEMRFAGYYDIGQTLEENRQEGRVPPPEILFSARRASVVFGVLSAVAVFVIGYVSATSLTAGLLAALLLLTNRAFVASATSAMTDIHYLFFLLCSLLAALWMVIQPRHARAAAIAGGICSGLACSVKVTGLGVGGLTFAIVLGYWHLVRRPPKRESLLLLALFSISAVVVVYLLNPYFWPSFAGVALSGVIDEWQRFSGEPDYVQAVVQGIPVQRYPQLARVARPLGFPLTVVRWSQFADHYLPAFGSTSSSRLIAVSRMVLDTVSQVPLVWIMMLAGLGISGWKLRTSFRQRVGSPLIGPPGFFVANYLIVLLFIEVNWARYFLPTSVGSILLAAIAVSAMVDQVISWIRIRKDSLR